MEQKFNRDDRVSINNKVYKIIGINIDYDNEAETYLTKEDGTVDKNVTIGGKIIKKDIQYICENIEDSKDVVELWQNEYNKTLLPLFYKQPEFKLRDEVFIFNIKNNSILKDVISSITIGICWEDGFPTKEDDVIYTFLLHKDLKYFDCYNNNIFISKDYDTLLKQVKEFYNNETNKLIDHGEENIKGCENKIKYLLQTDGLKV